jgi:hypothetical protein
LKQARWSLGRRHYSISLDGSYSMVADVRR